MCIVNESNDTETYELKIKARFPHFYLPRRNHHNKWCVSV